MKCLSIENRLIPALSFILGISVCISTAAMSASYLTLSILVLFKTNFISQFKATFKYKYVIASVLFYLVFVVASFWSYGSLSDIWHMLSRIHGYLLAPLFLLAFQTNNSGKLMLKGFILGAILSAALSMISYVLHQHILYGVRDNTWVIFHGHILHNAFLAIASSFLLLSILKHDLNLKTRILYCLCYFLCFIDIFFIVNGRTGQVIFLLMSGFIFIYRFRFKGLLLLLAISAIVLPILYFSPIVQKGIHDYNADMGSYEQGNAQTSMGARLVFHQVSLNLFKAKPIFGYGTGSFTPVYDNYVSQHQIKEKTTNPHRDLLWISVETGTLGIAAFFVMILCAILDLVKIPCIYRGMGLSLIIGYLLSSLENSFFIDNVTGMTFGFIMLALIAAGSKSKVVS